MHRGRSSDLSTMSEVAEVALSVVSSRSAALVRFGVRHRLGFDFTSATSDMVDKSGTG